MVRLGVDSSGRTEVELPARSKSAQGMHLYQVRPLSGVTGVLVKAAATQRAW